MRRQEVDLRPPPAPYKFNTERARLFEERKMQDFPIWLKLVIWGTIGLTVGYAIWGMINSLGQT